MDSIEVILTKQERLELIEISENISKAEIISNYTLNDFDLKLVNECRLDYNKIGFALQLGILRHKGYSVQSNINIPKEILSFVAKQLNIKSKEYKNYFSAEKTSRIHLNKIKKNYNYNDFDIEKVRPLTTVERSYIQTFPKNFIFRGTKTNLEQIIGNAVPVLMAEGIAKKIKKLLK